MTIKSPKAALVPAAPHKGKTKLHSGIARSIGERILAGEFSPGSILPNEAEWCQIYSASRTAVREAIKLLTAKGFITSRAKIGSRVEPRARWNLLDREVLEWHRSASDRIAFLATTQEARRLIEPGIAALAASKRSQAHIERLVAAVEGMRTAKLGKPLVMADLEFHEALLAAAGNELLAPFGAVIASALFQLFDYTTPRNPRFPAALKMHEDIVRAIIAGDPGEARKRMQRLLEDTDQIIHKTSGGKH
ncbi:MAG: FadR family transcriptional regulator [Alphaproteobacteria bacterium]|nr:FadR family transcriptional regulator [Alphaproteobacteria bacterium]